jgi:hypothetical protein
MLAIVALTMLFPFAAQSATGSRDPENTLLKHATRVTVFEKSEMIQWFGYQWISATEIVFQRQGGYVQRNTKTGAEQAVKGCPAQDKAHWSGGNLGASLTRDGAWMLYHGRRGNEEYDDGSLRIDRTDGSANLTWPATKFPEVAGAIAYWLSDNETWACPTAWKNGKAGYVSGVVVGSVKAPGKVRRIPLARGADSNWDVIATGRDRLLVVPTPTQRKPPAVSSVWITELILGTKVTGLSYLVRFPQRVYASSQAGLSSTGLLLWSLVVRGDPWHGKRPLVTMVAVSQQGHSGLKELGTLRTGEGDEDDEPSQLRWLPDGKHFSFLYRSGLYVSGD